jgi:uncharacterized protein YecE (DUF72 family)
MPELNPVRVGTSGFSAQGWVGTFYPEKTQPRDYLARYSDKFDTVEVDSTYYGTPAEKTVRKWYELTPPDFVFAAKVTQVITHEKCMVDCETDLAEFTKVMGNLQEKAGPMLLQFPYFNRKSFAHGGEWLARLEKFLPLLSREMKWALEFRNKAWLSPKLMDILRKNKVTLALIDHPYMPRPLEIMEKWDALTGDFVYLRLLGDRYEIEAQTKVWDKTVVDRTREIDEWADVTNAVRERVPVYTYVNNHFAGHAPQTVWEFLKRIETRRTGAPAGASAS